MMKQADPHPLRSHGVRPAPDGNFLLVSAFAGTADVALLPITRSLLECGCNLVDARVSTLGNEVSVLVLAQGSWDAIAKLENSLTRLDRKKGMRLEHFRTGDRALRDHLLPYMIEVVAADQAGALFKLAEFLRRQHVVIEQLHATRYKAMTTGAPMFSAQLTIGVPASMHIAALRDDFLEFCDELNLDAILDPVKF